MLNWNHIATVETTKLTFQALALPNLIRSDKRVMLPNIFNLRPNQLEKVVSYTQEWRVCFAITLQRRVTGKWNELVGSEVENIFVSFLSSFLPLLLLPFFFIFYFSCSWPFQRNSLSVGLVEYKLVSPFFDFDALFAFFSSLFWYYWNWRSLCGEVRGHDGFTSKSVCPL